MILCAVSPFIEITVEILLVYLFRWMDNGCKNYTLNTKCKSVYQYVSLYAGPVYLMQNRYNPIIVQVYCCFMFGLQIPIVFPLAFFGILNKYIVERIAITYWYRMPPFYNDKLSKIAMKILMFAPILMFITSYWAFGNKQIFENVSKEDLQNANDFPNPKHNFFNTEQLD